MLLSLVFHESKWNIRYKLNEMINTLLSICDDIAGGLPCEGGGSPWPVDDDMGNMGIWMLPIGIFMGGMSL